MKFLGVVTETGFITNHCCDSKNIIDDHEMGYRYCASCDERYGKIPVRGKGYCCDNKNIVVLDDGLMLCSSCHVQHGYPMIDEWCESHLHPIASHHHMINLDGLGI